MDLSLVIPVYNEAENLLPLCQRIREALASTNWTYEVVMIDDGSTDDSAQILMRLHAEDPRIKVLRFRRNFGQTAALAAGFAYAHGAVLVSLDGDLQNDPLDIPRLVAKLDEGYDLVSGWRVNRQDPFIRRRLPSQIANWLISLTTRVKLHDYGCTLKAFRRDVAKELKLYGEMHRFIPALAGDLGASIVEIPVSHHPRRRGRSKYGLARTLWVILDLLTVKFLSSYSTRPSHLFGLCGLLAVLLGGGITLLLGIQKIFFGVRLGDRPLLLLGILLIVIGVQFVTLGLIGEMLARTYHESQEKPIYWIKEVLE
ncbi:MAG TPA: glycosyltransferase family 2 protein [Candidatus Binatia bacterium]|jgi:glycosyltransferase involved in cell wall biosynthesis|nr:glycosyltransferase family 2 protein [Candidatus Binatia bacterium]